MIGGTIVTGRRIIIEHRGKEERKEPRQF